MTRGAPSSGVGILSRRPITHGRLLIGTPASAEGRGTRMRPLVSGRTYGQRFTAGHAPPSTSPVTRALYIARARAARGVVGCDWNQPVEWMRRTSTRIYRGVGVLGLLIPHRLRPTAASHVDVGSDHLTCDVKMLVPKRGGGVTVVIVRMINAQGVSEGRPWDEIAAAIRKPSRWGDVDVWLLCEIAWADLEAIAVEHDLHALHY